MTIKMKKRMLALAALLLLGCAGCGGSGAGRGSAAPDAAGAASAAAAGQADGQAAGPGAEEAALPLRMFSRSPDQIGYQGCVADGMYYIVLEDGIARLKYWDRASGQSVYLCSSPNCEHKDAGCTAFVTDKGLAPQLAVTDQHLLLLYGDYYTADGLPVAPKIELCDRNGGNRKLLYQFEANQTLGQGVAGNDEAVYLAVDTVEQGPDTTARTTALMRLDLVSQTLETLQSWENGSLFVLAASGRQLVYKTIDPNTGRHTVYRYDTATGETAQLTEYEQDAAASYAAGAWLFQMRFADGRVTLQGENWADGRSFVREDCFDCVTGAAGLLCSGFFHDTLFLMSVTGYTGEGNLIVKQYAVDLAAGTVTETGHEDPVTHRPLGIVGAVGPNEEELVLEENLYSGSSQSSWTGTAFSVVPLQEYAAGGGSPQRVAQ